MSASVKTNPTRSVMRPRTASDSGIDGARRHEQMVQILYRYPQGRDGWDDAAYARGVHKQTNDMHVPK